MQNTVRYQQHKTTDAKQEHNSTNTKTRAEQKQILTKLNLKPWICVWIILDDVGIVMHFGRSFLGILVHLGKSFLESVRS